MMPETAPKMDEAGEMVPRRRFASALMGSSVDRPPVWFMRQAGRYLPEYREIRERHSFHERLRDPELAAKITLQPMARFPLDAAVLFSDILVPLEALGVNVTYEGGPRIDRPVRTVEDVEGLREYGAKELSYVYDALRLVRESLPEHALLGFAGAPFTLAAYLVQGAGGKGFPELMRFIHDQEAWSLLSGRLERVVVEHLVQQARCGADAVQVFDTWAELLAPADYRALVLPGVARVVEEVRERTQVPVVFFARGTPHLLPELPGTKADCWSVDWRVPLSRVREVAPDNVTLQGNLDPGVLFAPPETVRARTRAVLEELGGDRHVFNLGHGILPGTPIAGVEAMVETVVGWRA